MNSLKLQSKGCNLLDLGCNIINSCSNSTTIIHLMASVPVIKLVFRMYKVRKTLMTARSYHGAFVSPDDLAAAGDGQPFRKG